MTESAQVQARPSALLWTGAANPGAAPAEPLLEDESGNIITDENGNPIEITV
jgi:hypothetical protein